MAKDAEIDLPQAIRILAEHVGMSTDARRQVAWALGDRPPEPPPPPPDPKDLEIARLREQLLSQGSESVNKNEGVAEPSEAPAEPVNVQVLPSRRRKAARLA